MAGATILFADIVGFSKHPTGAQVELVQSLPNSVRGYFESTALYSPEGIPTVIALPTGDGLALCLFGEAQNTEALFNLIGRVAEWANRRTVRCRLGVHHGDVRLVEDVNRRLNVCGDTVNVAQRVMDSANDGQVLFSKTAFDHHIGIMGKEGFEVPSDAAKRRVAFEGPHTAVVKHDVQVQVYVLRDPGSSRSADARAEVGDGWCKELKLDVARPERLSRMSAEWYPVGSEDPDFEENCKGARSIAFILRTGGRLLGDFKNLELSTELQRLWVLMPDPATHGPSMDFVKRELEGFDLTHPAGRIGYLEKAKREWMELLSAKKRSRPGADVALALYMHPVYYGAHYFSWEEARSGKILVRPFIWGAAAFECPVFRLEWKLEHPPKDYQVYASGLTTS